MFYVYSDKYILFFIGCLSYEKHFVYWRRLSNRDIGIVTLLHQAMHQIQRFKDDLESEA